MVKRYGPLATEEKGKLTGGAHMAELEGEAGVSHTDYTALEAERDNLTFRLETSKKATEIACEHYTAMKEARNKLQAAIESAPHALSCNCVVSYDEHDLTVSEIDETAICDCFKAPFLPGAETESG